MSATLIIQSFRQEQVPPWISACLDSVRCWAQARGYDYRFVGDEIFALAPDWYRRKAGDKLPVITDYARLRLLQEALNEGYQQVIWCDADMLIFDQALQVDYPGSCAFGLEHWVQETAQGRLKATRNVHNAICAFRRGCVVLPFLAETVLSIIRRADPAFIAPQMVGPKLLTALHSLHEFSLIEQVGALSPRLMEDILAGEGRALTLFLARQSGPLQAVNLCASLSDERLAEAVVARLSSVGWIRRAAP